MNQNVLISIFAFTGIYILLFFSIYNLCLYFHVDDKDVVKRLIAVKNHEYQNIKPNSTSFISQRSNFRFKIFSKMFNGLKFTEKIKFMLDQADFFLQVDTFIIISILIGMIPLIFALLWHPLFMLLSPVFMLLPFFYTKHVIKKKTLIFTQQLPDALDLLCNALRAGHSLFSAFEIVVKEMPNPIAKSFKILTDEVAMGIDTKDAMYSLQQTIPDSVDLRFFTTVIILQREIGGNLIKLLEILAGTIRERFKMIGQLRAQTAQARLSGIIVSLVPPAIGIVLHFLNPEYMSYLYKHIWGQIALGVSILLMITGSIVIKKITDIDI